MTSKPIKNPSAHLTPAQRQLVEILARAAYRRLRERQERARDSHLPAERSAD